MRLSQHILTVLSSILLLVSLSSATVIKVPQDHPTIQAGIDAAIHGDTVLVHTGRYVENVNFNGKNTVVGSLFLMTEDTLYISQTVIDGDSSGSVVTFDNEEDSTCMLIGFIISNGFGGNIPLEISWGGGISCRSSSPTLKNIVLRENQSSWFGGGIYCSDSNPSLVDVRISDNQAEYGGGIGCEHNASVQLFNVTVSENAAEGGGGICLYGSSGTILTDVMVQGNKGHYGGGILCGKYANPTLLNVEIIGNKAKWYGGGIYSYRHANPKLENVTVSENMAGISGGGILCADGNLRFVNGRVNNNTASWGGGIEFYGSSSSLENVAVVRNTASYGGGIDLGNYSDPILLNVTISNNVATGGEYGGGGGIYCWSSKPILVNSILWNNLPQEIYFGERDDPNFIRIAFSDTQKGENGIVTNDNGVVNWLEGNIDNDPLFIDSESGNFNLQAGSPCIDAGTAFFVLEGDTIVNLPDTAYEGNAPDMGAFESPYSVSVVGDHTLPVEFALHQPYPNPFNPSTTIELSMPTNGLFTLTVYDLLGREVETILNQYVDSGDHTVQWNASNIPSGIYFVRMEAGDFAQTRKVMVLR